MRRRFKFALMRIVLRSKPPVPALSRWTSFGKALDFYLLTVALGILEPLVRVAQRSIVKQKGDAGKPHPATDGDFVRDFNWHHVASGRCTKILTFLQDKECGVTILTFASVHAVFRYLTSWLLFTTNDRDICRQPALVDWVTGRFSPLTRVLQYLRTLVTSDASDRYIAIMWMAGFTDRQDFISSESPAMLRCHRAAITAASWLWYHGAKLWKLPWTLAKNADPRLTVQEKEALRADFASHPLCCLEPHCARKLAASMRTRCADDLGSFPAVASSIARIALHDATVECMHARNQRRVHENSGWASFCAGYINSEALAYAKGGDEEREQQRQMLLAPPALIDDTDSQQPAPTTALAAAPICNSSFDGNQLQQQLQLPLASTKFPAGTSGVGVYYQHRLKTSSKLVTATHDFWDLCKREFDDRSIVSQELADTMTAIGKHNAAKRRKTSTSTSMTSTSTSAMLPSSMTSTFCAAFAQLRPEQTCGRCGFTGSMHPRRAMRLDTLMRSNATDIERLLSDEPGSISKRTCKYLAHLACRCCDIIK